jgi:hypothetical protein
VEGATYGREFINIVLIAVSTSRGNSVREANNEENNSRLVKGINRPVKGGRYDVSIPDRFHLAYK